MFWKMPHDKPIKNSTAFNTTSPLRLCMALSAIMLFGLLFTGCGLLPQKEEAKTAPILKSYESKEYRIAYVEKGTIALEKAIECTYSQLNEEDLSFSLTGVTIRHVYYNAGDSVKKGDILAQLDLGDLEEKLEDTEYSIGELELLISQKEELLELEIAKQQLVSEENGLSYDEAEDAVASIRKQYHSLLQSYEDSLYLQELQHTSLLEEIDNHRLCAGMDGIISFIKRDLEGSESLKNEIIISIADTSLSAFKASTEYASYFAEGDEVIVDAGSDYETVAFPSQEEERVIFFQLTTPDINLKIGDTGTVKLVLEQHEEALYLPVNVVHRNANSYYVYYVDESGVQNMKPVEIGLENGDCIEIVSGLEYGEAVINK